jgi:hypothetical protein
MLAVRFPWKNVQNLLVGRLDLSNIRGNSCGVIAQLLLLSDRQHNGATVR